MRWGSACSRRARCGGPSPRRETGRRAWRLVRAFCSGRTTARKTMRNGEWDSSLTQIPRIQANQWIPWWATYPHFWEGWTARSTQAPSPRQRSRPGRRRWQKELKYTNCKIELFNSFYSFFLTDLHLSQHNSRMATKGGRKACGVLSIHDQGWLARSVDLSTTSQDEPWRKTDSSLLVLGWSSPMVLALLFMFYWIWRLASNLPLSTRCCP